MSKKLFVGGLSWNTNDKGLFDAFARFGEVLEAKVITERDTGRSRGFGFVTFAEPAAAAEAIAQMEGTQLDGRFIRVNEAQERAPGGGGRPSFGGPRRDGGFRSGGGGGFGGPREGGFEAPPPPPGDDRRGRGGRGGRGGGGGGRGGRDRRGRDADDW
jgi:RNA recognition motif-containing protein